MLHDVMTIQAKYGADYTTRAGDTVYGFNSTADKAVFDFSQNLANLWRGSNYAVRREILECVSLNRLLSDTSLYLEKRKPFDILAEGLSFKDGRGDWI